MDYGKFLYQQRKRTQAKKRQKVIVVKEVKFRINVDDRDYETKEPCSASSMRRQGQGDDFFRGREMTRTNLTRILERLIEHRRQGNRGVPARQEGNTLHAIWRPKDAGQKQPARSNRPQAGLNLKSNNWRLAFSSGQCRCG
jgi:translation initiation factor IF-3